MNKVLNMLWVFFFLTAAGCAVGPDFHAQSWPADGASSIINLPDKTTASEGSLGSAQTFSNSNDIPYQWWELFKSPGIDALISRALVNNPTLASAEATLREAQEILNARTGSVNYPAVDLTAGSSRQKVSPSVAGQPDGKGTIYDLHQTSVGVSYVFDIFGKGRREIEALKARVDHERFQLEAAYLSISGNVVMAAIQEAALRGIIQSTEEIILSQERQQDLLDKQLVLGGIARTEVLSSRAQLESTRATLPSYQKQLSRVRHQLAALLGDFPNESAALPEFDLNAITLPTVLPVSLASDLVRQRPDIRAAEELLHVASAQIGVVTADLYPQFSISGVYGSQAGQWENLLKPDSLVWSVGAGVVQPLFNGGALRARKRGAEAAYDQASAYFRGTVISAFQDVADVLKALEMDAEILRSQTDAKNAAQEALNMARLQFQAGAADYVLVLIAERQFQQSQMGFIHAQAARLMDTAALFQALGGGWWAREDIEVKDSGQIKESL